MKNYFDKIKTFIFCSIHNCIKLSFCLKFIKIFDNYNSQFILSEEFVQVFLMRYNEEVDEKNQVMLRNKESQAECLEALQSIPYNGIGN